MIILNEQHTKEVNDFAKACSADSASFLSSVMGYMDAGDTYKTAIIKAVNVHFSPTVSEDIAHLENPEIDGEPL